MSVGGADLARLRVLAEIAVEEQRGGHWGELAHGVLVMAEELERLRAEMARAHRALSPLYDPEFA